MRCLVTGGAGFIGSNLALELERTGNSVTVMDNLLTGSTENLKGFKGKIINADVSEPMALSQRFDAIFHEASITDPRHPNDEETYSKNINGFMNIVQLAEKCNAKLVYASTAGLYGNGPVPMKESQEKDVLSAYARSKLEMDNLAERLFGRMHIVGLRYFNVFGPNEALKGRPASMIYHIGKQVNEGKNPRIFKFGEHVRDHIYVKDVVYATILGLSAKRPGVYNVGTGIGTSFNEVVAVINSILGKNLPIEYFDMPYDPKTYQGNTQADTALAEKFLGFKARWGFRGAVADYMGELKWTKKG